MPKKIPSYLKGLVETRARSAGDIERYTRILSEVTAALSEAQATVESCDRLIKKFDSRLNPTEIAPVRSQRYGGRGMLKDSILEYLRSVKPAEATTSELAIALQVKLGLDFARAADMDRWSRGALGRALRRLVNEGVVERLHDPLNNSVGRWRLRNADGSQSLLEQLTATAEVLQESEQYGTLDSREFSGCRLTQ